MTKETAPPAHEIFASPFVDEALFQDQLGGSKTDPLIVQRYLSLPVKARPPLSFYFDRDFYLRCHPDIDDSGIDPLLHFIRWGVAENRNPHPLIDITHMAALAPERLRSPVSAGALHAVLTGDLIDPSPFFSLQFYKSQLTAGTTPDGGLLRHFLQLGILQGLRPVEWFDPLLHYRCSKEKSFDIRSCLHQLALPPDTPNADPPVEPVTVSQANALSRAKVRATQLLRARTKLNFDVAGEPDVSVIMVLRNGFALTLQTLASLRGNHAGPIELILIDAASTDETRHLSQYVTGARILRFESDIGFAHACNGALSIATAATILILGNEIELGHGAVAAARDRLRSHADIGAVGGKVVQQNAVLQDAGGIITDDGSSIRSLHNQPPEIPEANFVRDVDFCSAAFLLLRRALLQHLGGFDTTFTSPDLAAADLCARMRDAGCRTVYDPAVIAHHHGSAIAHPAPATEREVFRTRHQRGRTGGSRRQGEAPRRILLIEDQLPLRRLGSGFVRTNDIIRIMVAAGHHVTVYPIHPNTHDLTAVYADFPDTVEVIHDRSLRHLPDFLQDRQGRYGTVWIARTHNLDRIRSVLQATFAEHPDPPRIILDTEALVTLRDAQRQRILEAGQTFNLDQALRHELRNAEGCHAIITVSAQEAAMLQPLGFSNVKVLGHVRPVALTPRPWQQRNGLLFVGAIHTPDAPNHDSLCWFADEILPLIERQLGYETRLTVAGHSTGDIDLDRFRRHPRITLRGEVADLLPLYDSHRVFIAPTRYAAGLPYKIHEAASHGLPVVATDLLRRQLGWRGGHDLLCAAPSDPAAFARQVVALYRSEALWNQLRVNAAARIRDQCASEATERVLSEILC